MDNSKIQEKAILLFKDLKEECGKCNSGKFTESYINSIINNLLSEFDIKTVSDYSRDNNISYNGTLKRIKYKKLTLYTILGEKFVSENIKSTKDVNLKYGEFMVGEEKINEETKTQLEDHRKKRINENTEDELFQHKSMWSILITRFVFYANKMF